jgi:integrase/recombinase XerD
MAKNNIFIFDEDAHKLEPYKTFKENFIYWFKLYINNVFTHQSKRLIKDKSLNKRLINSFNSKNELNDLKEIINALSRNGFKGPKTYFNPIAKFFEFLLENSAKSMKNINTSSLKHFLSNELEELSFAHRKNIYTAIKSFLLFVEENNFFNTKGDNYVFKLKKDIVRSIGKEKKTFAYLDPHSEYNIFLNAIDDYTLWHKDTATRNKLILKILLLTGIRANELVRIKKQDITVYEDKMNIEIIGKGNKKRTTYLNDNTTVQYFTALENNFQDNDFLFVSRRGNFIQERYINDLVKDILISAGIPLKEKNGPHMLRHSCSTWLSVVVGIDIAKLQAFMDHEDIRTTKKYTHLNAKVVQNISLEADKHRRAFHRDN